MWLDSLCKYLHAYWSVDILYMVITMKLRTLLIVTGLLLPLVAQAQPAACPQAVPAAKLSAAMGARDAALLTPGVPVTALLHPAEQLAFALAPARKPATGSQGGLFAVDVGQAGAWRVSINSRAWVDVVRDGKAVASAAHAHPEGCSFFSKQVEFTLQPGRTLIQISSNPEPTVAIMVEKLP